MWEAVTNSQKSLYRKDKKREFESDLRSNEYYLSSGANKAWKKMQAC